MKRLNVCGNCGKRESLNKDEKGSFKLCGGCRGSHYCSKACQVANWPKHRVHCRAPTTDIKAKELRPFFSLINRDTEYKLGLIKLLNELPPNHYLGIMLTEAQIRAPANSRSYHEGKIMMIQPTQESRVEVAYDSRYFFNLFLIHDTIFLSTTLMIKEEELEMVSVKDCQGANNLFSSDAEPPTINDRSKFAKTLSKSTGSLYYRSKRNGRLYCLSFGDSNTTPEE